MARSDMKKAELLAECERLDAELAEADASLQVAEQQIADLQGAPVGPSHGLLPIVFHVGGVEWNGTARRLVRCACSGEWAEKWLVVVGNRMFTTTGHAIPFRPFLQVKASLQSKVAWEFEAGLKHLTQ